MPPALYGRIDGASLVDPALHSPEITELLTTELTRAFIEYIVDHVIDVVDFALDRPSSSARGRSARRPVHREFSAFARSVIERAGVQLPVLLGTLVYLDRARPHLQLSLEEWACERVFLGALICANKYLNDSTLKNVHWSMCTGLFNKRDVGRIEREFLDVLDFELRVTEDEILEHYDDIMLLRRPPPTPPRLRIDASAKAKAKSKSAPYPHRPVLTRHDSGSSATSSSSAASMIIDDDSPTSTDSGSLPPTPGTGSSSSQDDTIYVRSLSKHSPEEDEAREARRRHATIPMKELTRVKSRTEPDHPRGLTSAFSLLRNIHVPHFHHATPPSSASS